MVLRPTRRPGFFVTVASVMRSIIANLTPASGRQDHTTSPYAASPFVHAPKRATTLPCPPHLCPTFRDDRDTPLFAGRDDQLKATNLPSEESRKIFELELDRFLLICPPGYFVAATFVMAGLDPAIHVLIRSSSEERCDLTRLLEIKGREKSRIKDITQGALMFRD
jgi:hypothetical protein